MIIPTHDQQHAVAAVIDRVDKSIHAIDSQMNQNNEGADLLESTLRSLTENTNSPLHNFKVSMPPPNYPVQQTDDESCGIFTCMNLVGRVLGLQWESLEDLEQDLISEGESLSPEALNLIQSIYLSKNWAAPGRSCDQDHYKTAMIRASDDDQEEMLRLRDRQQEIKADRDAKRLVGDAKTGKAKSRSSLSLTSDDYPQSNDTVSFFGSQRGPSFADHRSELATASEENGPAPGDSKKPASALSQAFESKSSSGASAGTKQQSSAATTAERKAALASGPASDPTAVQTTGHTVHGVFSTPSQQAASAPVSGTSSDTEAEKGNQDIRLF